MAVIGNIISQHAEEAATLWLLRRAAARAAHYTLADLAKLDGRVEAHLDGLRVAGEDGWKVCEEQLAINQVGEVFAGAVLAFESGKRPRIEQVLKVGAADPTLEEGLVSALGWLPASQAEAHARMLVSSGGASVRRVGLVARAIHRRDPGAALGDAISDADPLLRSRALRASGELGRMDLLPRVRSALADAEENVRFAAAWSGALLSGDADSLGVLRTIVELTGPHCEKALQMAIRRMDLGAAKSWQASLSRKKERLRLAIGAAGAIGDPEFVPGLIEQMSRLPLVRVAGEAFTMITGVDLAYRDLERKPPEDFNAGPTEDPKDENVEMDPDDNLPWPDPALVQKWWEKNQGQFQKGTRHLLGKPMTIEWLKTVLRDGRQRQRAAAALELAIRQPGQPLFNVKAPGFRQIQLLGKPGPPIR